MLKTAKLFLDTNGRLIRDVLRMRWASEKGLSLLARAISQLIYRRYKCCISPTAHVSATVSFPHPVGVVIGDGAVVEDGCVIYQGVTLGRSSRDLAGYPTLKRNCIVYANAVVVGPIVLQEGTVVGAGAVVTKGSSEMNDLLMGVPARGKSDRRRTGQDKKEESVS